MEQFSTPVTILALLVAVITLIGMWKLFVKAGKPGWACIIPLYNLYVILKIIGKPGWWLILFFIPLVNIVINIIVWIGVAKAFSKGVGFGLGLAFLPFIFVPLLGFGDATYTGAKS
jgi:Family of unknown function (DUF5684)